MSSRTAQHDRASPGPRGLRLADLLVVGGDQTDEHGRLLLEDSAPQGAVRRAVRAGTPMETVACPYRDTPSRHGGQMNASAYEALRRDTAEIFSGFAWLARNCFDREPTGQKSLQGLAAVSKLGVTLPLVLFHRAREPFPPHGALPSFVASVFKASRGVYFTAFDMVSTADDEPREISAAEVVRIADREGHLQREQTGTVCAAPTRLIERTIEVILTGRAGGTDPSASRLAEVVEFRQLWEFYRIEKAFNRSLRQYGFVLEQLLEGGMRLDAKELFDCPVRVGGGTGSFGEFTEAFLRYATTAQNLLNRVLGRAENAPPVTFQDAVAAL